MARREERVDTELLARLESGAGDKIRVNLPNKKINEMFAIADQILGGRRVRAVCEDGESRLARIPGKMRRRQWVREGDLVIVQPWDFQDQEPMSGCAIPKLSQSISHVRVYYLR